GEIVHPIFLSIHSEAVRMLGMVAGERPYPVWAQEFVLIEHARQNAAQPLRIDQRCDAALGIPQMTRPGGMNALEELGHASQAFSQNLHHTRCPFALPRLDDAGGAEG